jgi:hypothetical protein
LILDGFEVRIDLRPVSSLLPHEETIPDQLEKMVAQIRRDGVQKDPLIVDRESGTVLDGMHRLAAFGRLGLENVVCCLVDYSSSGIRLERWARVYRTTRADLLSQAADELGMRRAVTLSDAFGLLEARKTGLALIGQRGCRVAEEGEGLDRAFKAIRTLDEVGRTLGWQRSFVSEDEVDIALQDASNAVLLVQRLNKQDVLTAARTSKLFPCKTSMHFVDPRPMALDFPVAELNGATSKSLSETLKGKSPVMLPPNSVYEGRRYKERLLLLDQS